MTLPLLIPHVIVGIAIDLTLAALRIPASLTMLVLAHILIAMPYALRVIHSTMTGVDEQYFHATLSLGGSLSTFILKVLFPMTRGALVNAFVFSFVVSFGDINVSLFLAPPDTATFPVQLYSKILWDSDPSVAAGSTIQIVLISAMTLLMFRLFSSRR
jgi:putative spermidine/putrescine transport system permease protein